MSVDYGSGQPVYYLISNAVDTVPARVTIAGATYEQKLNSNILIVTGLTKGAVRIGDFVYNGGNIRRIHSINPEHDRITIDSSFGAAIAALTALEISKSRVYSEVEIEVVTGSALVNGAALLATQDPLNFFKEDGLSPVVVDATSDLVAITAVRT